jgi:hypothetical protein
MAAPDTILSDRSVITITGKDTHDFLQRVITTDMGGLSAGEIRTGALLTPQGKILADFLIHGRENGVFLDIWHGVAESLVKRLSLYRLRADVQIDVSAEHAVLVGSGEADPRSGALPRRKIQAPEASSDGSAVQVGREIAAGVPAFGRDYGEAEVFPTDVNLDLYGGIAWKKGCFIGQEVLSRMKRRGTIRKRSVLIVSQSGPLDQGQDIKAGDIIIGQLTSADGKHAIARIRTDRLANAGAAPTVEGKLVDIVLPSND